MELCSVALHRLINQNNQLGASWAAWHCDFSQALSAAIERVSQRRICSSKQNLAAGNIYSGIANTGYMNAQDVAQQQQGVGLAAGQANRAAVAAAGQELSGIGATTYGEGANTASELGALGTGAQTAGLTGAQAQIGAGTLQQQTQQAQDTAQYNQFLQQQSYPFQVDQFLANIAEGTGALSGSTTTTSQPGGFFSDKRLKHNIRKIGKTFDGQPIYSYSMHGDPRTQIGLIAQDVEKKHPESVGVAGHYKVVDYGKATEEAANRGHFYSGGVVPLRRAYQGGGGPVIQYAGSPSLVSPVDLSNILAAQRDMYAPYSGGAGLYGNTASGPYGGKSHVPAPSGAVAHLVTPQGGAPRGPTVLENTKSLTDLASQGQKLYQGLNKKSASSNSQAAPAGNAPPDLSGMGVAAPPPADNTVTDTAPSGDTPPDSSDLARGGVAGRHGYDDGGNAGEEVPTELNIPDSGSSATKPATQQPPALQNQNHDLQDIGSLVGIAAGIASMAKRGGRIKRADGGATDDDDSDQADLGLDEAPPTPTPDAPPSDSTPVPTKIAGVAPTSAAKDTDAWYKHAANVVPLLTGLAAMGTAPTKHLGVALSAGLGAGAQSWLPAQEQSADIQSRQIQNQMAQLQLDTTKQALNDPGGLAGAAGLGKSPTPGVAPAPTAQTTGTDYSSYYRSKYFVPPVTPQEQTASQRAIAMGVSPVLGNRPTSAVNTEIQQRVSSQQAANKNDAQNEFDKYYGIATTASDPKVAADAAARANAAHQWTGDDYVDKGGVLVNSRTGQRPVGAAGQVIPPSTMAALVNSANQLVEVPRSDGSTVKMPLYAANHAQNAEAYARHLWDISNVTPGVANNGVAGGPSSPSAPSASRPAAAPTPSPPIPVRRPADQQALLDRLHGKPGATLTTPAPAPAASVSNGQAPMLPGVDLGKLTKTQVAPVTTGASPSTAATVKNTETEKARQAQLDEAAGIQKQASENNALLSQFQSKLTQINPRDVGPGSAAFKRLMELKTAVTAGAPQDLVDMEVVDKFANQLGVQNVRSLLSGQRITNQEMMNFLTRASASTTQPVDVMRQIIAYQKSNNDYDLLKSNTKAAALQDPYNADPRKIDGEIENMSHRSDFVHNALSSAETSTKTSKSGRPMTFGSDGQWHYAK